ncbi:MAG TPA: hypothetical protein VF221_01430 [Chloroflexota bacterium]
MGLERGHLLIRHLLSGGVGAVVQLRPDAEAGAGVQEHELVHLAVEHVQLVALAVGELARPVFL